MPELTAASTLILPVHGYYTLYVHLYLIRSAKDSLDDSDRWLRQEGKVAYSPYAQPPDIVRWKLKNLGIEPPALYSLVARMAPWFLSLGLLSRSDKITKEERLMPRHRHPPGHFSKMTFRNP